MGKRFPEDVQVVGYDGIRQAEERTHYLSTIRQPIEEMATEAVQCSLDILDKKDRPIPNNLTNFVPRRKKRQKIKNRLTEKRLQ